MKRFLITVSIFLLPVFIAAGAVELALRNIPNDYKQKRDYITKHGNEIEVLCLGNSHMFYGINPEYFSLNTFNGSHISQSIDCDLALYQKYGDRYTKLRYLIMVLDYVSVNQQLKEGAEAWRVKNYNIYYDLNLSYKPADHFELLSSKMNIIRKRLDYYKTHQSNISCAPNGWGYPVDTLDIDFEKNGAAAAKRHKLTNPNTANDNIDCLSSLISDAQQKGIKVILLATPAHKAYVKHLDKAQLKKIEETGDALSKQTGVIYMNLLNDSDFVSTDFMDPDHMNVRGAKKLSLKLDSIIRSEAKGQLQF